MTTLLDLNPALAKAEQDLRDFDASIPEIQKLIDQKRAYLMGKLDMLKEMMTPAPKDPNVSPEGENHEPNPGNGFSLQQP